MNDVNTEAERLFSTWEAQDQSLQYHKDRQNPGLVMSDSPDPMAQWVIWAIYAVIAAHVGVVLWNY